MNLQEYDEQLLEKIILGLEISHQRMLETKSRNNEDVVIMQDGKIVTVKASELLKNQQDTKQIIEK